MPIDKAKQEQDFYRSEEARNLHRQCIILHLHVSVRMVRLALKWRKHSQEALDDEVLAHDNDGHQGNYSELSDGLVLKDEALGKTLAEHEGAVERIKRQKCLEDIHCGVDQDHIFVIFDDFKCS